MSKSIIYGIAGAAAVGVLAFFLFFGKNLDNKIVLPYIAHQKPMIDPHLPSSVPLANKLDEVLFDGLFNISANPSGITYEDGLGEYMGIDDNNVVTIRLKPAKKWHSSFKIITEDEKVTISDDKEELFDAKDLLFTMRRIQMLGSLSPDYILLSQALEEFNFIGPDQNNELRLKFRDDRIWMEDDIKEVLSFKILPHNSEMNAPKYMIGSGPYLAVTPKADMSNFYKNPSEEAVIDQVILEPFIDNGTYTTELKNNNINALLSTPFGALSPILEDEEDFFFKSNISTVMFAILYNTQRLSQEQRVELRKLIDNKKILNRFFKVGSKQQRHIVDYKGNKDNFDDYLNYSIFPSSSYYVDEEIVTPLRDREPYDASILADTIRIQTCLNYGFREELSEIVEVLNDPSLFQGKIKALAVQNDEIRKGNYDALLIPITGYRSNFLFDLYNIFLREPNLALQKIHLITEPDGQGGRRISSRSFEASKNFFRFDLTQYSQERSNIEKLLEYLYGFMSTREVGDKQAYARFIDELDQQMALGSWLFSLPSLAYFSTQFDKKSIDLYGVASQLSTIEKWQEKKED
jgi:hypothetical protein